MSTVLVLAVAFIAAVIYGALALVMLAPNYQPQRATFRLDDDLDLRPEHRGGVS